MNTRDPVVLLPGTLCTEVVFAAQADALRAAGHEVHVMPLGPEAHVDAHAAAVVAAAPERFALAGFSQGAITALAVLRRAPERVTRLALLALNPGAATDAQRDVWRAWRQDGGTVTGRRAVAAQLRENVAPERRDDEPLGATVVAMAEATDGAAFAGQLAALASRPDAWSTLEGVGVPCALGVGEADPVTPLELHERIHAALPVGATLTVFEGAGHYAPLERPSAVARWLVDWASGAPSGGRVPV